MITVLTADTPKALAYAMSDSPHKIYMYLEYTNAGVPGYPLPQVVPGFSDPLAYYWSLIPARNFLRVPAVRDPNVISSLVNLVSTTTTTFFAQSSSPYTGSNSGGAPLTDGTSQCYGAALVLVPDEQDRTKDLVLGRSYFTANPITKTATSELFVTFPFSVTITGV